MSADLSGLDAVTAPDAAGAAPVVRLGEFLACVGVGSRGGGFRGMTTAVLACPVPARFVMAWHGRQGSPGRGLARCGAAGLGRLGGSWQVASGHGLAGVAFLVRSR